MCKVEPIITKPCAVTIRTAYCGYSLRMIFAMGLLILECVWGKFTLNSLKTRPEAVKLNYQIIVLLFKLVNIQTSDGRACRRYNIHSLNKVLFVCIYILPYDIHNKDS